MAEKTEGDSQEAQALKEIGRQYMELGLDKFSPGSMTGPTPPVTQQNTNTENPGNIPELGNVNNLGLGGSGGSGNGGGGNGGGDGGPPNPAQPPVPQGGPPAIYGITEVVQALRDTMSASTVATMVVPFDGSRPEEFRSWIKMVLKAATITGASGDEARKKITYQTSRGPVSDYIKRYLNDEANYLRIGRERGLPVTPTTWAQFKSELAVRFSDSADHISALHLLKECHQRPGQSVQVFSELILGLSVSAFEQSGGVENNQNQILSYFCDGLLDENIRLEVMKANPRTFHEGVSVALNTEALFRRFNMRGHHSRPAQYDNRVGLRPIGPTSEVGAPYSGKQKYESYVPQAPALQPATYPLPIVQFTQPNANGVSMDHNQNFPPEFKGYEQYYTPQEEGYFDRGGRWISPMDVEHIRGGGPRFMRNPDPNFRQRRGGGRTRQVHEVQIMEVDRQTDRQSKNGPYKCWVCSSPSHFKRECPVRLSRQNKEKFDHVTRPKVAVSGPNRATQTGPTAGFKGYNTPAGKGKGIGKSSGGFKRPIVGTAVPSTSKTHGGF